MTYNLSIDYGIFVAIISTIVFCITIPLKIMSEKHNKLKEKAEPQEREIKKKYGINPLGASVLENIEKPSEEICKKYQLATFKNDNGEYAHVIIFSYQDPDVIKNFVLQLYLEKLEEKGNQYVKVPTN